MLAKSHHKKKNYELSLNKFLRRMFMSHQQNAVQDKKTAIICFKNLANLTYSELKLTHQKYILEEVKAKLSSGNSCYRYIQTVSFFLLSKNVDLDILNYCFAYCFVWE
jgi:hypothetical protein